MMEFFKRADQLYSESKPFVVVTLVSTRGHAPQNPGAKAIFTSEGLQWGTVGGGKIEMKSRSVAFEILEKAQDPNFVHQPQYVTWNLQKEIGMSCGGEASLLFELHNPLAWQVVVFGAGHVVQALVRALEPLKCQIQVVDSRQEWLQKLPESSKIKLHLHDHLPEQVVRFHGKSFFVVITQGHGTDVPVLKEILSVYPDAPFVGVLGSDLKAQKIRADLLALGIPTAVVAKLHCPMGLAIGDNSPGEIAISIAAELILERDRLKQNRKEKSNPLAEASTCL